MTIDEGVYEDWLHHPCTRKLHNEILINELQRAVSHLLLESVIQDSNLGMKWLGKKQAIEKIIKYEFSDYETKEEKY